MFVGLVEVMVLSVLWVGVLSRWKVSGLFF